MPASLPSIAANSGDLPSRRELCSGLRERRRIDAELRHEAVGAERDLSRSDAGCDAEAGEGFEILRLIQGEAAGLRRRNDRLADRMFGILFDRCGERQHFVFTEARSHGKIRQLRMAFGQRARLVEGDDADIAQILQRRALPEQDSKLGRRPVATMIETGVAKPMAQGQAMISTATMLTSA